MLRKGSSVEIRASRSFGYGKVGGSSPSPSTNARITKKNILLVRNKLIKYLGLRLEQLEISPITYTAGSFPDTGTKNWRKIMKDIEELEFEIEHLRKRNKELHRRLQQKESPWQSEVNSLRLRLEWKEKSCHFSFNRMCSAHDEMKEIFKMIAPLYKIPCRSFHSVMDSNFNDRAAPGIWANVFTKRNVESYRVIDIVKQLVNEREK